MSAGRTRLGVNLLWLVPGVVGGSEEYATRLLAGVADVPPDDIDVTLYVNRSMEGHHRDLNENYRVVVAPLSGAAKGARVLAEATWLRRNVKRHGMDVVHHLGGTMPPLGDRWGVATIVTVHDLQPLAMPQHFGAVKRAYLNQALPRSVAQADKVVTLTEFTRDDLVERLSVPREKIAIVPAGLKLPDDDGSADPRRGDDVLEAYGLVGHPYFVYPAITYPHKNHALLLEAFDRLRSRHPEARLVLTSGPAGCEQAVLERIATMGEPAPVLRTGRIPEEHLDVLYRRAVAVTFPSTFEGFGLPVLEAMARGCPVVAAEATALTEVVGSAGLLLDPHSPEPWVEAMTTMIERPEVRARFAEAGRQRASHYSWERSTTALLEVWRQVAASTGGGS